MKKTIKLSALVLALLMVCLSFSGCDDLDEKRESHATFTNEGEYDSITYNGEVYKIIADLSTTLIDPFYNIDESNYIVVTEPNTPLLLSDNMGSDLEISNDGNFIKGIINNTKDEDFDYEQLYCKEDIYDDVKSQIETGIDYPLYGYGYYDNIGDNDPKSYYYHHYGDSCYYRYGNYEDYDYDDYNDDYEAEYEYYYLNTEEIKTINEALEASELVDDFMDLSTNYLFSMTFVSEDKMFGKLAFDMYIDHLGNYVVSIESDSYPNLEMGEWYSIPSSFTKEIDKITETAIVRGGNYIDYYYY